MKERFDVTGMGCAMCSSRIESGVGAMEGVKTCKVNLLTNSMECEFDGITADDVIKKVVDLGYGASVKKETPSK